MDVALTQPHRLQHPLAVVAGEVAGRKVASRIIARDGLVRLEQRRVLATQRLYRRRLQQAPERQKAIPGERRRIGL